MIGKFIVCVAAGLGTCFAFGCQAVEYRQILADRSSIVFAYRQMNVPMEGRFKRFSGQINFDPTQPAAGHARIDIDATSIDTGASDSDEEIRGKLWFNTRAFPQAQFVSASIKPAGANVFDVAGKLTIKGKPSDVHTLMTLRQEGSNALLEGALTIKRSDFAVGEGMWADFATVANEVEIRFRLLATANPVSSAKK